MDTQSITWSNCSMPSPMNHCIINIQMPLIYALLYTPLISSLYQNFFHGDNEGSGTNGGSPASSDIDHEAPLHVLFLLLNSCFVILSLLAPSSCLAFDLTSRPAFLESSPAFQPTPPAAVCVDCQSHGLELDAYNPPSLGSCSLCICGVQVDDPRAASWMSSPGLE